jgi:hypothetical protein
VLKAKVFDSYKIGTQPWRFNIIMEDDGCMEVGDLLTEDRKIIGQPKPGDEILVIKQKRKNLIVGLHGKIGPNGLLDQA